MYCLLLGLLLLLLTTRNLSRVYLVGCSGVIVMWRWCFVSFLLLVVVVFISARCERAVQR